MLHFYSCIMKQLEADVKGIPTHRELYPLSLEFATALQKNNFILYSLTYILFIEQPLFVAT